MQGIKSIADKISIRFCCFKYIQYLLILNIIISEIHHMNNDLHIDDYIASVKVRDFMFGDLEKTLSLVKTSDGDSKFSSCFSTLLLC
jgi:hypothetical protein